MKFRVIGIIVIKLFLNSSFLMGNDPINPDKYPDTKFINQVVAVAQMDLDALLPKFHTKKLSFKLVPVYDAYGYYHPEIYLEVKVPNESKSQRIAFESFGRLKYEDGLSIDAISGAIQSFASQHAFQYLQSNAKFATPHFRKVTSRLHSSIPYRNTLLKKAWTLRKKGSGKLDLEDTSIITYEWIIEQISQRNKRDMALHTVAHYMTDGVGIHPHFSGGDESVVKYETVNIQLPDKSIFPLNVLFHNYDYLAEDERDDWSYRDIQKHHQNITAYNFLKALDTALLFNPFLRRQMNFSVGTVWKNAFSAEGGKQELPPPSEIILAKVVPPEIRFRLKSNLENLSLMKQTGDNHFEFHGPQDFFPGVNSGNLLDLSLIQDRLKGLAWFRIPELNPSVFYLVDPNSKKPISNYQSSIELWNSPIGIELFGEPTRIDKLDSVNSFGDSGYRKFSMTDLNGHFQQLCGAAFPKLLTGE